LGDFEKSLAKPNSIFARRGEVLAPKFRNKYSTLNLFFKINYQ
jgi:hypothetical protein